MKVKSLECRMFLAVLAGSFAITFPAAADVVPASQPVVPGAPTASLRVVVIPFDVLSSDPASQSWLGRAVQQSVLADLSRLPGVQPIIPESTEEPRGSTDLAAVVQNARALGTQFVVAGSVQAVGQELRMVGQVIDVNTGAVVGGLKSTGSSRDLFSLEDTIATQVRRSLPQSQPVVIQAPAPAEFTNPVRRPVDERSYLGSDLDRAVRTGFVNRPNVINADTVDRDYYYGQPSWGYGGYFSYGLNNAYYGGGGFTTPCFVRKNVNDCRSRDDDRGPTVIVRTAASRPPVAPGMGGPISRPFSAGSSGTPLYFSTSK